MSGLAQPGRTAGSFHGQDQDQEGLVEMAVVELGGFSKGVGDELVRVCSLSRTEGSIGIGLRGQEVVIVKVSVAWSTWFRVAPAEFFFEFVKLSQGALPPSGLFFGRTGRNHRN